MADGYSPVLPLQRSEQDGFYALTKTLPENIKQNFKNLVLTSPGERVMLPDFGVGVRDYLFEIPAKTTEDVQSEIFSKVTDQVAKYMPFIKINNIDFNEGPEDSISGKNVLSLSIFFSIPEINMVDVLSVATSDIT